MRSAPKICTLKVWPWDIEDTALRSASANAASFAHQAAKRLHAVTGIEYSDENIEPLKAEEYLLKGQILIVVGTLPLPLSDHIYAPIADMIVPNASMRFLLSHPSCFVVFATWLTREAVDRQLQFWMKKSGAPEAVAESRRLATSSPLYWSLVTIEELLADNDESWRSYADIITMCADRAVFDPTGIRSLLHFVLNCIPENSHDAPPLFAAVADDEMDVAVVCSYHLRRLGYSVFTAYDSSSWRQMIDGGGWKSKITDYDAAMIDDHLAWAYGDEIIGHDTLAKLPVTHKIYITGKRSDKSSRPHLIHKPVLDALSLTSRYEKSNSSGTNSTLHNIFAGSAHPTKRRPQRSFKLWSGRREDSPSERDTRHHDLAGRLMKETASTLSELASKLESFGKTLEAALHFQEAHILYRFPDDRSAAAEAFHKFQALEIREIATRHPDIIDRKFWPDREKEIVTILGDTFVGYEAERLWWTARVFQEVESIMKASLVEGGLIAQVDKSLNKSTFRFQWYQAEGAKWPRWLSPAMWFKSLFLLFSSLKAVAFLWVGVWVAFAIIYGIFSIGCKTEVGEDWPLWVRSAMASLVCGIGIDMPHSVGMCLPKSAELWVGVLQRLIILFIVARLIDLFVTRSRGRA